MFVLLLLACRVEFGAPGGEVVASDGPPAGEVWVYTSMYQNVLDALEPEIEASLPGVDVRFFQAGSEKVAQRIEAEWDAGGSPACLILTSDPFWYVDLKERGRIVPHFAPTILHVDRSLVDRDGYWATARISLMVLAVNEDRVTDPPKSFAELAQPVWKDRISIPDPMASGTAFSAVAMWLEDGGWERIEALDANGMIAAGGNSSVLTRVETGEREVGAILLENLLVARRKGSPAVPVYPSDGAIPVPGPIALTADCPNPTAARAVYDYLMAPPGQAAIVVEGDMYAALPELAPPRGAPALTDIAVRAWPEGFAERIAHERVAIKEKWAERGR